MLFKKQEFSETELIDGCLANSRRHQEVLYRRFFPKMMSMVMRYAGDEDDGDTQQWIFTRLQETRAI
jgi:hypothetical protein